MKRLIVAASALGSLAAVARADEVTHWNSVLMEAIRVNGGPPCPIGRACAMMHLSVYDAVNSITRTHEPYLEMEEVDPGASKEAAVCAAARRILVYAYPAQAKTFNDFYEERLALIPAGPARDAGVACGESCAQHMMVHRSKDGSNEPLEYVFGKNAGDYVTPEDLPPGVRPFNPEWGNTLPFAMKRGDQFRNPGGPYGYTNMQELLQSSEYVRDFNEVRDYGSRNSTLRTEEQTQIAFFWANDVDGTYKPPGHLMNICREVSKVLGLTLDENVRLFAMAGLGMGDAGVLAWDAKYNTKIDFWRPISGVRRAETDGNPETIGDPKWQPLNPFTPPFPAWISGHGTFGAVHAAIMTGFFGRDNITFTITSEDPFYNKLPSHPARTFHSFRAAGQENADSRVYLGVHWRFDVVNANHAGTKLGQYISQNFLRKTCIADFNNDHVVNSQDFFEYLEGFLVDDWHAEMNGDLILNSQDFFDYLTVFFTGC